MKKLYFITFILLSSQLIMARIPKLRYTIPLATNYIAFKTAYLPDGTRVSLTPKNDTIYGGDTVAIQAGTRDYYLRIKNLWGSQSAYVVLTNKGGKAIIRNEYSGGGMSIKQSKYIHFTGTGTPGIEYGILIDTTGAGGSALSFDEMTTDFECDHIEINRSGFAGIMCKTDPWCDGYATRGNFLMQNISFHHNYIHNTAGEGFYIGHSSYNGIQTKCSGQPVVIYPHDIHNIKVYDNIIEYTGLDGIQISCCTKNVEVYNNRIRYYGWNDNAYSKRYGMEGIIIGGGSTGNYYNNTIVEGCGTGIMVFGLGNINVFNNLIIKPGRHSQLPVYQNYVYGIFCDDRTTIPGQSFNFANNTIVSPRTGGMKFMSSLSRNNRIYNNVILDPGGKGDYGHWGNNWMKSCIHAYETSDVLLANNVYDTIAYPTINNYPQVPYDDPYFVDASNYDFHLLETSPLVDVGIACDTACGFGVDFDGVLRPQGNEWDVGAYEKVVENELIPNYKKSASIEETVKDLKWYFATNQLVITSNSICNEVCNWELIDMQGRICESGSIVLNQGLNPISLGYHSKALYIVRLFWGSYTTYGKGVL
jgi:hypothetical protein